MKFTGKVRLDTKGLEKLTQEFSKAGKVRARVGVLGGNADRQDGEPLNNADIGAVHEMGSKSQNIPARSFLRVPCTVELPKALRKIGGKKLLKMVAEKGVVPAMQQVGVLAENVVDEAFETRGSGKWAPNSPVTIARKGSDSPLIDTGKLRRSITSKVYVGSKESNT